MNKDRGGPHDVFTSSSILAAMVDAREVGVDRRFNIALRLETVIMGDSSKFLWCTFIFLLCIRGLFDPFSISSTTYMKAIYEKSIDFEEYCSRSLYWERKKVSFLHFAKNFYTIRELLLRSFQICKNTLALLSAF